MGIPLLEDLEARGLIHDSTDRDALAARLSDGPVTLYHGMDPTADSLHIGNLVGLLMLRRFQDAGHRPIALAGGATGMIGDPSGRTSERALLDEGTLAANLAAIKGQITRVLGAGDWQMVDNNEWTGPLRLIDFLRDVGKHVTVNQMVAKESVKARMVAEEGISFTEFTYMLLQAHDYLVLHQWYGCNLQIGGSDQWGNITAGIDLVRRHTGSHVHGLTWPLLLRSDGKKFGKSEGDNVWLDAGRTSPYRFYQYWINVDDRDVERFLLALTLLPTDEVASVMAAHAAAPERREGQRRLAEEVTTLVHGAEAAVGAQEASGILFGSGTGASDATGPSATALAQVAEEAPRVAIDRSRLAAGVAVTDLVVEAGLCGSRSDARRQLAQGGIYVNGRPVDEAYVVGAADLLHDRWVLLRRGRKTHAVLEVR